MKLIAIGDLHGRSQEWKDIITKENPDKTIFIGDYFDSFTVKTPDQVNNFLDIVTYARSRGDACVLLLGNHDMSYVDGYRETCSGYQERSAPLIQAALRGARDLLKIAHLEGDILFTHAGVSKNFHERMLRENPLVDKDLPVDQMLQQIFEAKPNEFRFYGRNPYGDDVTQSCIWIRPNSLGRNLYETDEVKVQVVGHTPMKQIVNYQDKIYFIDTLENGGNEYLIIEDNEIEIGKL